MTRFRNRVPALIAAVASILALSAAATTVTASAEDNAVPSRDFSVENAAEVLPQGYEQVGSDFIYEDGAVIITPAAFAAQAQGCVAHYVCLYRNAEYEGDRWMFQDEYWQNLRNWGASDVVSSWKNRQGACDNATLGWNSTEQGITPAMRLACTDQQAHMGNWNDEGSSIHG